MTRAEFTEQLVSFLNGRLAPKGVRVEPGTRLFGNGLLDSMKVLELIAWTEKTLALRIPDEQIRMDHFRTPERIAEVFVDAG